MSTGLSNSNTLHGAENCFRDFTGFEIEGRFPLLWFSLQSSMLQ